MNARPMTKEDNAAYASRSKMVRMAGAETVQRRDARKACNALKTDGSFVRAAMSAITSYEDDYLMAQPHMTAVY